MPQLSAHRLRSNLANPSVEAPRDVLLRSIQRFLTKNSFLIQHKPNRPNFDPRPLLVADMPVETRRERVVRVGVEPDERDPVIPRELLDAIHREASDTLALQLRVNNEIEYA